MKNYNYGDFSSSAYNLDNFQGPKPGTKAPDFTLSNVAGESVNLLSFTGEFLVLEMGSITCPLFQGRRKGMSELVDVFPNVSFSVLYVREAHPGSHFPSHKSLDDKRHCAKALQEGDGEKRTIIIDDLAGSAHEAYGSYPNAIFIINKNGCIVFCSDWNSVPATKTALTKLLNGEPATGKSYFLPVKPTVAIRTLRRSGKGALKDFLVSLPTLIWKNLIKRNVLLLLGAKEAIAPDSRCN